MKNYKKVITDDISIHEKIRVKGLHKGEKEDFIDIYKGQDFQRDTKQWNQLERVIDRKNKRYDEDIRDVNGCLVHECHQPLPDHRNHGSAKKIK